ncbi:iron-sulfur flavoprotein [Oxobacter pfennigii]|uniref:Iron-sulfur flavoprotein n=1 Tax=Oxobacter pfennigii TaxID=36849 RepID=A0A0P8YAY3_9CLOT|nr:flavodoxin family protein [Oxobacter pfennigii]KPU44194.1 iron-sulfur flavoprotein [Oxobacter pfennigii]
MKNVIVIYGGPRRSFNTELLLDKFLEGFVKDEVAVEKVILKELNIIPCTSCYGCSKDGRCIIRDDMTEIYSKLKAADIIVLASPIYFGNVTAITKSLIDRCQAFWSCKYIAKKHEQVVKKTGVFVATAGSKDKDAFTCSEYTVKLFFDACDANFSHTLYAGETDSLPVHKNSEVLEKAFKLGRSIA